MGKNMSLSFDKPAIQWEEAFPLGNGSLGAMVFGNVAAEKIQLNQESVWSCGPRMRLNPDAREALEPVRKLIFNGQLGAADELIYKKMLADPLTLGHYEPLADFSIVFDRKIPHHSELFAPKLPPVENYQRSLDFRTGIYRCSYGRKREKMNRYNHQILHDNQNKSDELVFYEREAFISYPDQVMAMELKTSAPTGMRLEMTRGLYFETLTATADRMVLTGTGTGNSPEFVCAAAVVTDGNASRAGSYIDIEGATVTHIYITGRTGFYKMMDIAPYDEKDSDYQLPPAEWCEKKLTRAMQKGYEILRRDHLADVCPLFDRVELDLGEEDQQPLSAEQFFNFGRYLTIASSRPGSLPSNLQGLWNASMNPSWGSRYTLNINLEMNYWLAEAANLPECVIPLLEYIHRMIPEGKKVAREMYGCRGAVAHHNSDIYGDCAPNEHWMPASLWPMGLAWLGTHIIEHYRYTQNPETLKRYLPDLMEIALFFVDFLIPDPDGYLVTCPSTSPENTYLLPNGEMGTTCYGPTMDVQIVRDVWNGYLELLEAAEQQEIFGKPDNTDQPISTSLRSVAEEIRRLYPLLPKEKIGSRGQLLEWQQEYQEWEQGHRHISHLYGLYPAAQISEDTPELWSAARKTLEERLAHGGGGTGWSRSWIINFWARLKDGEAAYQALQDLLKEQTAPNLFDLHPALSPGMATVFQIDGNFGGAAGILEMLLQTQNRKIEKLPALPRAWASGYAKGLRCRGGQTVEFKWGRGDN